MPDQGVPCQLDFFGEFDFSSPGESPPPRDHRPSTGRGNTPAPGDQVHHPAKIRQPLPAPEPSLDEGTLTRQASELVAGVGLEKIARKISVQWNPRMRTTAGRAFYEALRVELNPALLRLEGIDTRSEIDRTLRHELAHLVAYHRAERRRIDAHGEEWRQACADLGIPDESRCHSLPLEPRRVRKKLIYECPVCGSQIHRVRKFRQAVACYECCRQHNQGRFDNRFRLVAKRVK